VNIIVIVADSLRADHLGCYGSSVKTPNIDAFAADAALFEEAYSENLPTMPTRTAWWTGHYLFPTRKWQPLELSDKLLAEVLWNRGFTSAFVTDVYHMHKPSYNCGRGFDYVSFLRGQEYDPWIVDASIEVDLSLRHRLRGDESDRHWRPNFEQYLRNTAGFRSEEDYFAPRVVSEAIRWLDHATRKQKDNLFMWVDCFDPHEPWDPPDPWRRMYDPGYRGQELIDPVPGLVEGYMTHDELAHTLALYAGEVSFVDKWVGVLLDRIRELGLYDNSLIMFTSDHGEPFGEHGIVRKAALHGYEELCRIPWVIRYPSAGRGRRFDALVQTPDLMPTVLDAAGVATDLSFTGTSLIPILSGTQPAVRDFAVSSWQGVSWTIRTAEWTYSMLVEGGQSEFCNRFLPDHPHRELYNRRTDRAEQHNVIEQNASVADELELKLRRFAAEVQARNRA